MTTLAFPQLEQLVGCMALTARVAVDTLDHDRALSHSTPCSKSLIRPEDRHFPVRVVPAAASCVLVQADGVLDPCSIPFEQPLIQTSMNPSLLQMNQWRLSERLSIGPLLP
jgi:hypothetical protein